MRVLISICPYLGHLRAHVPLASELVTRGHLVAFATEPGFCTAVRGAGFECRAVGARPRDPIPADREGVPHASDHGVSEVKARCADLVELARAILPDVIVRDEMEVAAAVAAEALSIPCVTLGFTELTARPAWDALVRPVLDEVRSCWALNGDQGGAGMGQSEYLNLVPRAFRQRLDPVRGERPLRPVCRQKHGPPPPAAWLEQLPARPTVHVALGAAEDSRVDPMATIAAWLSPLPISLICTAEPDYDLDAVASIAERDNVHITNYVPLEQILSRCDAAISSGGFNAMMGALQFGLPVLAVPLRADHQQNASKAAGLGAGIRMTAGDLTREAVVSAVRDLLTESTYRVVAARLQEHIERMPGPDDAAAYLEAQVIS